VECTATRGKEPRTCSESRGQKNKIGQGSKRKENVKEPPWAVQK